LARFIGVVEKYWGSEKAGCVEERIGKPLYEVYDCFVGGMSPEQFMLEIMALSTEVLGVDENVVTGMSWYDSSGKAGFIVVDKVRNVFGEVEVSMGDTVEDVLEALEEVCTVDGW